MRTENPVQRVLVVAHRDDELEDELPRARNVCAARADVGVLPAEAGVLLVDADRVGNDGGFAVGRD